MCLANLAWLLLRKKQLDAAEEAASRAIDLLPEEGEQLGSVNVTAFWEEYINPRARRRRPFTISRQPSELPPLLTTARNYFGFIST
jgi:hypothetical protein